jgi:hypothetical protein
VITPCQNEVVKAAERLMSLLTQGLSQQERDKNSKIQEPQSIEDHIESDCSVPIFPPSTQSLSSNDDRFYSLPTSTKRKADGREYAHEETMEKPKTKKPRCCAESPPINATKGSGGREMQSEAQRLKHCGKKWDAYNNPYSYIAPFVPSTTIPEGPVPAFDYISYPHIAPFIPKTKIPEASTISDADNSDDPESGERPKYYIGGGKWSYSLL